MDFYDFYILLYIYINYCQGIKNKLNLDLLIQYTNKRDFKQISDKIDT